MPKFKVTYTSSTDHDCCSVWTTADHASEAIDNVMDDYWDVEEIIECRQIN